MFSMFECSPPPFFSGDLSFSLALSSSLAYLAIETAGAPSNALARAKKAMCEHAAAVLAIQETKAASATGKRSTAPVSLPVPSAAQWPLKILRDASVPSVEVRRV